MSNPPATREKGNEDEATLLRKLEPLVKPGQGPKVVEMVGMTVSKMHSGPLPPPEDLAGYEAAHPGAAERILAMAERNQAHRHKQENRMVIGEFGLRFMGQVGALLTIAMLAGLVGLCSYLKQPLAAGVVAAIGAASAYFLHRDRANREPKASNQPSKQPRRKK